MDDGIVHDGVTIRYMTDREREMWRENRLPAGITVIVAPDGPGGGDPLVTELTPSASVPALCV